MENQSPEQIEVVQKQILPSMISSPERIAQISKIGSKADPKTQAEVMYELYTIDLRKTIATIDCPVMLMGAWIAYKQYGMSHDLAVTNYKSQVVNVKNCDVQISDTAKHFIFFDDPQWFFEKMDGFLN
jgi:pimeloyl-ACP methyl ester carboxylesterase